MFQGRAGAEIKTADAVVGRSGKPLRVYSVTWLSGGSAGTLVLRNGTVDTDNAHVTIAGTISQTKTQDWYGGLLFPAGCFYDHDSNTTRAIIMCEEEA